MRESRRLVEVTDHILTVQGQTDGGKDRKGLVDWVKIGQVKDVRC